MDELIAREIARKYQGTVGQVFHKVNKTTEVVYFVSFDTDEDDLWTVGVQYTPNAPPLGLSKREIIYPTKIYKLSEIEILPMPDRQVFDFDGITMVYERMPKRQWRKGITRENTAIDSIVKPYIENYGAASGLFEYLRPKNHGLNLTSLYNLFVPNHANTLKQAISDIEEYKLLSRTIDKSYYLCLYPSKKKQYVLFRFQIPVAFYNRDKNIFTLTNKLYYQEVLDFVNRHNLHSSIEV